MNRKSILLTIILILLVSLCLAQQDTTSNSKLQISAGETILLSVSVTDEKGNHLLDLSEDNFTVFVNGKPQDIVHFSNLGSAPSSICILFDASNSMNYVNTKMLNIANQIPARLAAQGHESNEYFLITFNEQSNVLLNGVSKDKLLKGMNLPPTTNAEGSTKIYDALSLGIEKLRSAAHKKRAILLITDGYEDSGSQTKLSKLKEQVGVSGIPIYFLSLGNYPRMDKTYRVMEDLVEKVGGGVFVPTNSFTYRAPIKVLEENISFIINDIRYQYTLGFKAVPLKDKWHRVEVKFNLPPDRSKEQKRILVRSRKKYYADMNSQ